MCRSDDRVDIKERKVAKFARIRRDVQKEGELLEEEEIEIEFEVGKKECKKEHEDGKDE